MTTPNPEESSRSSVGQSPARIRHLRTVWERLAREDPYWAVLTSPDKAGNRWQVEEFFKSGEEEIATALARLDRLAPGLPRGRALDFGCGVGRLTLPLARSFAEVVGVDVAQQMIELARGHDRTGDGRVSFVHNPRSDLQVFPDAHFDLVFSLITLQHVPRRMIGGYLREFVRVLRPGGVLYFQLPTFLPAEVKRWSWYPPTMWTRIKRWTGRWLESVFSNADTMTMTSLPERRVRKLLQRAGATVVEVIAHPMDHEVRSLIYVVRKG